MSDLDSSYGETNSGGVRSKPNRSAAVFGTERSAREMLVAADPRYHIPTKKQRRALMVSFAERGIALVASAYDVVRLDTEVDLDNPVDITANAGSVTVIEIKSTNQERIGADLSGYFFNITSAELLVAQSLGQSHRFVFVNTARGDWQELGIRELLAKAKAMYPAFHIRL